MIALGNWRDWSHEIHMDCFEDLGGSSGLLGEGLFGDFAEITSGARKFLFHFDVD